MDILHRYNLSLNGRMEAMIVLRCQSSDRQGASRIIHQRLHTLIVLVLSEQ